MPEPRYADDGFFLRRIDAPDVKGIEVCSIDDVEPTDCKLFREGTPEFAVAEKLLDLLEAGDKLPAAPIPAEPVFPLRSEGTLAIEM